MLEAREEKGQFCILIIIVIILNFICCILNIVIH